MTDQILVEAAQALGVDSATPARFPDPSRMIGPAMAVTPMAMIAQAVASGAGLDLIERLMALQERWQANQARMAFNAAISEARAKIPPIVKNRRVAFKGKDGKADTDYRHEDLAGIAEVIDPILGEHGLSYRFRTDAQPDRPVTVTCVLSHRDGHSEENTLTAPRDGSGNKNPLQQIASAVTYLSRYTLKAALGLSAAEVDDDGRAAGLTPIQADALIAEWSAKFAKASAPADLDGMRESLRDLPPDVRAALVGPYKAAQARLGGGRREPPTPEEIAASGQPGAAARPAELTRVDADAVLKAAHARLPACKTPDAVMALWDELVEPVKDRLADGDYNELLAGFDAARLKMKDSNNG